MNSQARPAAVDPDLSACREELARLREEYEERETEAASLRHELSESQAQQAATSEILSVISNSPTDVQPVLDVIARKAVSLCNAEFCGVVRYDGELVHLAAHHNIGPEALELLSREYPFRP